MDILEVLAKRRTVRSYIDRPVAEPTLEGILEATRKAPSAGNLEAYTICVVREERHRKLMARAAFGQDWMVGAPVHLVFFAAPGISGRRYGKRGIRLYSIQDATIAATYGMLAAEDAGLATGWVGSFDPDRVISYLGADSETAPVVILCIGHTDERPVFPGRRPITRTVWEPKAEAESPSYEDQ